MGMEMKIEHDVKIRKLQRDLENTNRLLRTAVDLVGDLAAEVINCENVRAEWVLRSARDLLKEIDNGK